MASCISIFEVLRRYPDAPDKVFRGRNSLKGSRLSTYENGARGRGRCSCQLRSEARYGSGNEVLVKVYCLMTGMAWRICSGGQIQIEERIGSGSGWRSQLDSDNPIASCRRWRRREERPVVGLLAVPYHSGKLLSDPQPGESDTTQASFTNQRYPLELQSVDLPSRLC